jgi:hypothetical protein
MTNSNQKDNFVLDINEYKDKKIRQALEENAYSKNPKNALEIIADPEFFNDNKLYADSFKKFILIGQRNCVERDLSNDELLKMRTAYMQHCKANHYTNKDFFNELYALRLTYIERHEHRALSSKEKFAEKMTMAIKYDYKKNLFKSTKLPKSEERSYDLPKLREISDTRRNPLSSIRKKNLSLANFFASEFADIEASKEVNKKSPNNKYFLSHDENTKLMHSRMKFHHLKSNELFTIYKPKFEKRITYYPPVSKKTKARIIALAASGIAAFGIANTAINNYEINHAYENAVSQGITLEEMGLSSSENITTIKNASLGLDVDGYGKNASLDQKIIDLLESEGTIGLYNDIQTKLNYYKTNTPTHDEMNLFLREIQILPNAVANDKIMAAYKETENGQKLLQNAGASISADSVSNSADGTYTYYNVKINDSFTHKEDFNKAQYGSEKSYIGYLLGTSKLPKDLIQLIDADGKIDELASDFQKLEESLNDGIITEYDYLEEVGKAFTDGKIQNLIAPIENFAARDVKIENKSNSSYFDVTGKIKTSKMDDEER